MKNWKVKAFFVFNGLQILLVLWIVFFPKNDSKALFYQQERKKLAKQLLITDFCISTENRHTRHPNTFEPVAPFQDSPAFFDYFPSSVFWEK